MKPYTLLIVLIIALTSCKESNETNSLEQNEKNETATAEVVKKETATKSKNTSNGTFLCKINGKDWAYTKASGIVDTHAKTKKRTAIITFIKKLDRGSETVQLFYDADTKKLEKVNIHLKVPKNDGKTMTAMYIYHPDTNSIHPNAKISGTIDLSNPTKASGNAGVSDLDARFEKNAIANTDDKLITVEGINFTGVGYSDLDKAFGSK
ncbi:hypothetical protein [Winogradskyella bathintestinalis]|uniref:Uncharacterized protein n=1 Tax=Winogradskyella bathintestinalis TaxID=3035208 RepID=A0ABT7ZX91_9FLAO|nr:hypothetical protein [Winogradskyella bathintestinalis]MDN3493449.1 hypothetical protein [Winogradskyella bathintestinalis]